MSKVIAVHFIDLNPGVNPQAFEEFVAKGLPTLPALPGWQTYVAKGDRGERKGKYAVIHEFDSLERRDHYFPAEGNEIAPEVQRAFEGQAWQTFGEQWNQFATSLLQTVYTDYVTVD